MSVGQIGSDKTAQAAEVARPETTKAGSGNVGAVKSGHPLGHAQNSFSEAKELRYSYTENGAKLTLTLPADLSTHDLSVRLGALNQKIQNGETLTPREHALRECLTRALISKMNGEAASDYAAAQAKIGKGSADGTSIDAGADHYSKTLAASRAPKHGYASHHGHVQKQNVQKQNDLSKLFDRLGTTGSNHAARPAPHGSHRSVDQSVNPFRKK
jgi:hypothetical protein